MPRFYRDEFSAREALQALAEYFDLENDDHEAIFRASYHFYYGEPPEHPVARSRIEADVQEVKNNCLPDYVCAAYGVLVLGRDIAEEERRALSGTHLR